MGAWRSGRLGMGWGLLLALIWCQGLGAGEVVVGLVDGDEVRGVVGGVDPEKGLVVGGQTIALAQIAELQFTGQVMLPIKGQAMVHLRNGDRLCGAIQAGDDAALKVVSTLVGEVLIKNDLLRGIAFPPKAQPAEETENPPPGGRPERGGQANKRMDDWQERVAEFFSGKDPEKDQILTPKGEVVPGFVEKLTDKALIFDTDGQKRELGFDKLAALRYAALEAFKPLEGVRALAQLTDGSTLSGSLGALQGDKFSLALGAGLSLQVPQQALVSMVFSGGRLVYLSELEPSKVEERPLVGGAPVALGWRRDAAVSGERLRLGRKEYAKGLGMRSYCRLGYDLKGQFATFLAEVGLDAAAPSHGACAWKVLGDGKELGAGEALAGGPPKRLKLPVLGVAVLELVCDFGPDEDDAGDHLDWAQARLLKK